MNHQVTERLLQLYDVPAALSKALCLPTSFSGTESLSNLFSYEVTVLSQDLGVTASSVLGKSLGIVINQKKHKSRKFHGIISYFEKGEVVGSCRYYHLALVPELWSLTQTCDYRLFEKKSVLDVIENVLKTDFKISYKNECKHKYGAFPYLVQYNESTYNFAARLLQDAGIYFYFGLENARHKLFLADAATQWEKIDTAFHYYQDKSNDDIDTAIYSWQRGEALVAGKVLTGYTPFLKSTETLNQQGMTVPTQAGGATLPKNYEKFFYLSDIDGKNTAGTNSIKTAEDLDKKARDIGHSESLAGIEIHSSSTCSQIASGRIFKLETHPDADEIGAYRIVQVSHQARDSADELIGAQTEKEPAHYSNSFVVIPEALTYRPLPLIEKPKASSLSRAKVVSKSGKTNGKPTVDTDEYGRVKVQFFWDRHKASSAFLRVAQCWAGGSWGMNFIPRVGDEVLVGFIDGDPDQPLIVGSVPNHSHPLPYKDTASKSGIRSLSLNGKKAHEICFDDSAEKEKLVLRSDKEIVLEVGKTTIVLTEGGIKLLGKRIDVD